MSTGLKLQSEETTALANFQNQSKNCSTQIQCETERTDAALTKPSLITQSQEEVGSGHNPWTTNSLTTTTSTTRTRHSEAQKYILQCIKPALANEFALANDNLSSEEKLDEIRPPLRIRGASIPKSPSCKKTQPPNSQVRVLV